MWIVCAYIFLQYTLQVHEESTPRNRTIVPPEKVIPFWPLTSSKKLVAMVANTEEGEASSAPFLYQSSDFSVLQFSKNSEVSLAELHINTKAQIW